MADRVSRPRGLLPALALLALLAALVGLLLFRAARRGAGPGAARPADGLDRGALVRLLGPPEEDLPPDRFSERVDGADASLRRAGCLRILAWRLGEPVPADLELYAFRGPAPARSFLRDRGLPDGTDRAAMDGLALLRAGRCAVLAVPDDPGAASAVAAERLAGLAPALVAAGCGEPPP